MESRAGSLRIRKRTPKVTPRPFLGTNAGILVSGVILSFFFSGCAWSQGKGLGRKEKRSRLRLVGLRLSGCFSEMILVQLCQQCLYNLCVCVCVRVPNTRTIRRARKQERGRENKVFISFLQLLQHTSALFAHAFSRGFCVNHA